MSIIETLITDRTQGDVDRVNDLNTKGWLGMTDAEKDEWLSGLKGAYNATDLNRVTSAMEYLVDRLKGFGYEAEYVTVEIEPGRTVWQREDIPTAPQLAQYLSNVEAIRDVLDVDQSLPASMKKLTYEGANEIEQALVLVEQTINQVVKAIPRLAAHTFWSGNRPLPSAESDLGHTWDDLDAMNLTWDDLDAAGSDWYLIMYGVLR